MTRFQTRCGFLGGVAIASATSLIRTRWAETAEGLLETTTVRIQKPGGLCGSSLYIAEELLRAEHFTDIRYADPPEASASGRYTATSIFLPPMPHSASGRSMPVNR